MERTEDSLSKLNLQPDGLQVVEFSRSPIKTYGLDLKTRYETLQGTNQVVVTPEIADADLKSEFDAPPIVVWEWLNDPQKRNLWWESYTRWTKRIRPGGRTGPGAVNHCDHGVGDMLETVLDWRPFDYYTVEMQITPGHFNLLQTTYLKALPDGKTEIEICYQLQNPRLRWMAGAYSKFVAWFLKLELKRLKRLLDAR